jgi:hypothetical protein
VCSCAALDGPHRVAAQVQELIAKCNAGIKAEAEKHKKMFGGIFQKKEE